MDVNTKILNDAWKVLRENVYRQVLNSELVPVKNLSEASHFSLFTVFIKDNSDAFLNKLNPKTGIYHVLGHISQVIDLDRTDVDSLLKSALSHQEDCNHLEQMSRRWEDDVNLERCSVRLTLKDLFKLLLPITMEQGDLYLNVTIPGVSSAKSIYIVTDVIKANRATATYCSEDGLFTKSFENLTVGFGYTKFRLTSEGRVAEQKKTKFRRDKRWEIVTDKVAPFLNVFPD